MVARRLLRLQAILANEIDSLTIDAENLKAVLELKEVRGRKPRFELAWERTGANRLVTCWVWEKGRKTA